MGITTATSTAPQLDRSTHPLVLPGAGASRMFGASTLSGPQAGIEFNSNVPQSSTEYSIAGEGLDANQGRPEERSGLGLHILQKLAHLIGGRITFASLFGHGSSLALVIAA